MSSEKVEEVESRKRKAKQRNAKKMEEEEPRRKIGALITKAEWRQGTE